MNWLYYLLEANLYLLIFYGFYRLFLYNETFYNSNRYYLLLTSITSFILPVLQLGFLKPAPIVVDQVAFPMPVLYTEAQLANMKIVSIHESIHFGDYLYPIYLLIALGFAVKLAFSLFKIVKLWIRATKKNTGSFTLIELNDEVTAFSFFNLLFINPRLAQKQTVVAHELVHIKQKHSLDVLFFELLQIICWFNPILYFIKKDIKLLHEYIADELTTNTSMHKHEYALFLIENSFGVIPTPLTNQIFNQSILKRRINMLNKKRTAGWARLRLLLALPLVAAMLCASTVAFSKDYGYVDLLPEKSKTANLKQEVPKVEDVKRQTAPKTTDIKRKKTDQVKFPPPIVRQDKLTYFTPWLKNDKKTGHLIAGQDKRYILINGSQVKDNSTFYGVTNAETVKVIDQVAAVKIYGDKAKYGAVIITGSNIRYNTSKDQIRFPPPIVVPDQVKFPPSFKPKVQNRYIVYFRTDKATGNQIRVDNRVVVVNGEPIADLERFYGAENLESITILNPDEASKKYPKNVTGFGAVELTGSNIKYYDKIVPPPTVTFPPPIIKKDRKKTSIKSIKGYPANSNAEVIVQGYASKNSDVVTVKGYPTKVAEKVQGVEVKDTEAITVKGNVTKSNEEIVVKGYPTKAVEKVQGVEIKKRQD